MAWTMSLPFGERGDLAALSIMLWSIPPPSQLLSQLAPVVFPQLYLPNEGCSLFPWILPTFI